MHRLIPIEGEPPEPIELDGGTVVFGRDPVSDVVLDHRLVSRRHARLEVRPEGVWLIDEGSKNGSFVNGRRISGEQKLEPGDLLHLGGWKARFESGERPPEQALFVIEDGRRRGEVRGDSIAVGRASGAEIVVRDSRVSRVHTTLSYRDGRFVVRDTGSTNGTFVDGRRVVEHVLAGGEEITLCAPPEETERPPAVRIRTAIEGPRIALSVGGRVPAAAGLGEDTAEHGLEEITRAMLALGAGESRLETAPALPVLEAPVKGKAKYRSQPWVPTADLSRRPIRRVLVLLLGGLALAGGLGAVATEQAGWVTPGEMRPGHASPKFRAAAGPEPACAACHDPWGGTPPASCLRCHEKVAAIAPPHDRLELACASCHREHERVFPDAPAARHRCTDCHRGAHAAAPAGADPAHLFLNKTFGAARVHAGHLALKCEQCHASAQDQETGRVSTGCAACHGGGAGVADARCQTCHRFHSPREVE